MPAFEPLTGRCLCGRIQFAVSAPLLDAEYCHCRRCQRRTGAAASASAEAKPGSFRVTAGQQVLRAFKPEGRWHDYFCGECGSLLYCQSADDPQRVCVSLGAFDADPGVHPEFHQYVAYAAPWDTLPDDGLPRYDESWREAERG
jgi:hypothetical protein